MNEPPLLPALYCSRCGSMNPPHATACWLCGPNNTSQASESSAILIPDPQFLNDPGIRRNQSLAQALSAVLLVVCVVLTILVGVGLAAQEPGSLVPYAIFVGPAYLATGVRALYKTSHGERPTAASLLMTFLMSGVFTFMAVILLAVASFVAFFVWCLHEVFSR